MYKQGEPVPHLIHGLESSTALRLEPEKLKIKHSSPSSGGCQLSLSQIHFWMDTGLIYWGLLQTLHCYRDLIRQFHTQALFTHLYRSAENQWICMFSMHEIEGADWTNSGWHNFLLVPLWCREVSIGLTKQEWCRSALCDFCDTPRSNRTCASLTRGLGLQPQCFIVYQWWACSFILCVSI